MNRSIIDYCNAVEEAVREFEADPKNQGELAVALDVATRNLVGHVYNLMGRAREAKGVECRIGAELGYYAVWKMRRGTIPYLP